MIANVLAQHGHGKPDEAVSGSLDDALANQACAIFTRPALGTVAALNDIRHARRLVLVNRHGLDKETLRTAQPVIQRRVNRFVELGDGIRMATEAGAAFAELPFNQMVFPFVDTVLYATETTVGTTNESIYVNKAGKRFCDEGGSRTDMTIALMEQDGGVGFQVVDHDSSMITDGKTHTGMDVEYAIERGILYRADTLEELAGLMGVDEATFLKTVDDYNEMTRTFNDPEFGRSSFGPNAPLDNPPFYASPRTWAMHITMDGISTDSSHRALDAAGNVVPGLYVVGEAACGGRGVGSLGAGYAVAQSIYNV